MLANNGKIEIVKFLIKKGGNVNALNNLIRTPLHSACEAGTFEILEYLVKEGANVNVSDEL